MDVKNRIKSMNMAQYLVTAYVVTGGILSVGLAMRKAL